MTTKCVYQVIILSKKKETLKISENPLAGGSFNNWIRLWRENGLDRKYIIRAVYVTFMTLVFAPFRVLQTIIYGKKIQKTVLNADPIIILGHFRCGGTFLTNLMTQDPQWGFMSTTQAVLPGLFLLGKPIRDIFKLFLHEKRPMDNVRVTPESPEEPEHAICNTIPFGFYQGICYPDKMLSYFHNSVSFKDDPTGEILGLWEKTYYKILKACSLANGGKRLVVKNPPDTARITQILKLFPDAKFIFIYRNPFVMFPSIRKFYLSYIVDWQLTDYPELELEENILTMYREMMEHYQRDKKKIPEENLVEVKFEDFEADPLGQLKRVYSVLGLDGFEKAAPAFEEYLESQKSYVKNRYTLTAEDIALISDSWSADIERWGYIPEGAVDFVSSKK
jgi:hypothetical protein